MYCNGFHGTNLRNLSCCTSTENVSDVGLVFKTVKDMSLFASTCIASAVDDRARLEAFSYSNLCGLGFGVHYSLPTSK